MMVRPLPGIPTQNVVAALKELQHRAEDARSGITALQIYERYVGWSSEAASRLSYLVDPASVDALVLTRRHWALQALDVHQQTAAILLLRLELDERIRAFETSATNLEAATRSWSDGGALLLPDTNVYLHHSKPFDEIDWFDIAKVPPLEDVTVVVPLLIVDELDAAKRRSNVRSRARTTLKALDAMLLRRQRTQIAPGEDAATYLRLFGDDPAHRRMPDADSELIDRALALATIASRPVSVVTFDTGMSFRAKTAGVPVVKLTHGTDD